MKRVSIIFLFTALLSCSSDDRIDDPIPFQSFADFDININLPAYTALKVDGGYKEFSNLGVRGIIIYRENATTFRAFEQNCSFQPQDACATVKPFSIYMQDACCGSVFNYDGEPTGGLAWRPLGQYEVHLSGSTLTITDNVINY